MKRFNDVNFDWNLNYSNALSYKHFDNKFNKFDLWYWRWHCWKYCKKIAISLYKSNSNLSNANVESKISISWNVNVDLTICFALKIFLNLFCLTIFEISNVIFNFCCFDEVDDFNEMKIDNIITNSLEKNVFVKTISKSCNEMNIDWSSNQTLTKSMKTIINKSNNFDSQYKCKDYWKCWKKFAIWLNNSFSNQL